jgi:hypothetical protein
MNRIVLGAVSALLLAGAGLFWWQGQASTEASAPPAPQMMADAPVGPSLEDIPDEDGEGMIGPALPPEASEATREEKRFNRLDRNRDNVISRTETMQPRIAAFRKLDKDRNNLLSFEEWAVTTSNRFKQADGNGDSNLTRQEFATTKPKQAQRPGCKC